MCLPRQPWPLRAASGGRVGEDAVAEGAEFGGHARLQLLQARTHHLVVIAPTGIDGHHAFLRALKALKLHALPALGRAARQVVHAGGDDADGAGHQLGRARALQTVRGHVVHAAVKALRQPLAQARLGAGQVHARHADLGKSQLLGPGAHALQQCNRVDPGLRVLIGGHDLYLSFPQRGRIVAKTARPPPPRPYP